MKTAVRRTSPAWKQPKPVRIRAQFVILSKAKPQRSGGDPEATLFKSQSFFLIASHSNGQKCLKACPYASH
jgi:hypothetical protein